MSALLMGMRGVFKLERADNTFELEVFKSFFQWKKEGDKLLVKLSKIFSLDRVVEKYPHKVWFHTEGELFSMPFSWSAIPKCYFKVHISDFVLFSRTSTYVDNHAQYRLFNNFIFSTGENGRILWYVPGWKPIPFFTHVKDWSKYPGPRVEEALREYAAYMDSIPGKCKTKISKMKEGLVSSLKQLKGSLETRLKSGRRQSKTTPQEPLLIQEPS